MALVTTTVLPFSCFSGFSGEILFFHCNHVPTNVHNKTKISFISCLLLFIRKEKLFVYRRSDYLLIFCFDLEYIGFPIIRKKYI